MQISDIMAISDDPSETHQWGEWSTRLYDGLPVPEDLMAASEAYDTLHKYMPKDGYNSVEISVAEIGNLTIGAKKEAKRTSDWTTIGGFKLYYLGIGDDEVVGVVGLEVGDGLFVCLVALEAVALVEGEVGLVGHAVVGRSVNDGLIEGEDGILLCQEVSGDLLGVGVEAYAEE